MFNCAAWTDVDGAESSPEDALAVNGAGAGNVARAGERQSGAWTIHVSSDYVFDGTKRAPYVESDAVPTRSPSYGRSKLAGELRGQPRSAPGPPHDRALIVAVRRRRSVLSGDDPPPRRRARRAERGRRPDRVPDVHRAPGGRALLDLAARPPVRPSPPLGIVHLAGGGACSWYEFAREIVARAGLRCEVKPCTTADMPRPATRPAYSVLGSERGDEAPAMPPWRQGLTDYAAAMQAVSPR